MIRALSLIALMFYGETLKAQKLDLKINLVYKVIEEIFQGYEIQNK